MRVLCILELARAITGSLHRLSGERLWVSGIALDFHDLPQAFMPILRVTQNKMLQPHKVYYNNFDICNVSAQANWYRVKSTYEMLSVFFWRVWGYRSDTRRTLGDPYWKWGCVHLADSDSVCTIEALCRVYGWDLAGLVDETTGRLPYQMSHSSR